MCHGAAAHNIRDCALDSVLAIGLMSGTSRDGIDAALIETDGDLHIRPLCFLTFPYTDPVRELLAKASVIAQNMGLPGPEGLIDEAENVVNSLHLDAVNKLIAYGGFEREEIEVIGFHGHTIAHKPELGWSWQLGKGGIIADEARISVMSEFRQSDLAEGGQGAPIMPVFHRALTDDLAKPLAILNLGGVANLTAIYSDGDMCAFDTGMANALIDDWMLAQTGAAQDENGEAAARGTVNEEIVAELIAHRYFRAPPPKSLDRDEFSAAAVAGLAVDDGAATLAAFSAEGVARGLFQLAQRPDHLYVSGGGRKNLTLMRMITARSGVSVTPIEKLGWNGDAIEAQGMAYLAARRLALLPASFPGTTGVSQPTLCGTLFRPIERRSRER